MLSRGPSLPPRVDGESIGTLSIHLVTCSISDICARIQFWGEPGYSYFCLSIDKSVPVGVEAIEYPLVGSILTLNSYLRDASPLRVVFLRHGQGHRHLSGEKRISNLNSLDPEVVGYSSIRDVCINIMPCLDIAQNDSSKKIKISLRRKLNIECPVSGPNDEKSHVGEAIFEFHFAIFEDLIARAHWGNEPPSLGLSLHQSSTKLPEASSNWMPQLVHRTRPPFRGTIPCIRDKDCNLNIACDSMSQYSDLCASSAREKQSLLEELLDLCTDDSTLPTFNSIDNHCVDPYEMWISRIVANATSPAAKGFPCVISAGTNKSSALQNVRLLKLEINELTLMANIANEIKGNVLYLQYSSHPFVCELKSDDDLIEVRLCAHSGERYKLAKTRQSLTAMSKKSIVRNKYVFSDRVAYEKQIEVNFKDDYSIRNWLTSTLDFSISYRTSKTTSHLRLPRVAMLAGMTKDVCPIVKPGRTVMAKASFSLCDIIMSETLSVNVKLDLVSTRSELCVNVGEVIGTLTINLGLYPDKRAPAIPDISMNYLSSSTMTDENALVLVKGSRSLSPTCPHPISVILSYFAGEKNDSSVAVPTSTTESKSSCEIRAIESINKGNENHMQLAPKPVTVSPAWLSVRVERMSNSLFDAVKEKKVLLKLYSVYSNQFIPHDTVSNFHDNTCSGGKWKQNKSNTVCSWQVPIGTESERGDDKVVNLQIWFCHNITDHSPASEQCLVGLAKLSFRIEPAETSQKLLCKWLSDIIANGWVDVLDPKTNTPTGKIKILIAAGTLKQTNSLPAMYKSILAIQRWWIRSRPARKLNGGNTEQPNLSSETEPKSPKIEALPDCSHECDSIHDKFITEHDKGSPDSLFEEWSQQSLTASNGGCKVSFYHARSDIAVVPCGDGSIDSIKLSKRVNFPGVDNIDIASATTEFHFADSSASGHIKSSSLERSATIHQISFPTACDQFDVIFRLEKIRGLREMLSAWCTNKKTSAEKKLLSVSGVFISYSLSVGNVAVQSQDEELCNLCSGTNGGHSNLLPIDRITRCVEMNFESIISVPNCEMSTEMILSQTLACKLWFVPIITTSIESMINSNLRKDIQTFNGCEVISVAKCPLYHLYTIDGHFAGRVPWSSGIHTDLSGNDVMSSIEIKVHRLEYQRSPIKSLLDPNECTADEQQCLDMSCLKPMKLEVSFSRDQEAGMRPSIGVDPPEEITQIGKRKSGASSEWFAVTHEKPMDEKRCRVTENTKILCLSCPEITNPLQVVLHDNISSVAQCGGEKVAELLPNEASFVCSQDVVVDAADADDTISYRSLTSVIGSLERINSLLTRGDDLLSKNCSPDDPINDCLQPDVLHVNDVRTECHNEPSKKRERPDPGRHIEPPEENNFTLTPAVQNEISSAFLSEDILETCERGSSPMSVVYRLVHASTSPSNNTDSMEAIQKVIGDPQLQDNEAEIQKLLEMPLAGINATKDKNESDEQSEHGKQAEMHEEISVSYPQSHCREQYLSASMDEATKYYSLQSMYSRPYGFLPHLIGVKKSNLLSPPIQHTDPQKYGSVLRGGGRTLSRRINTGAKNEKQLADNVIGTLSVDTEKLERIFRS